MRWLWRVMLIVTFILAALISAVAFMDNADAVSLKFLEWQSPLVSIYWWILFALTAGFISGSVVLYATTVKIRISERKFRRELLATQQELERLKGLS
jgi:uncharacterized integral membrane protein